MIPRTFPRRAAVLAAAAAVAGALALAACSRSPTKLDGPVGEEENGAEPVFPGDYLETFAEVRDCRFSSSHPGMVRVLVNDIGAAAYLAGENPLPAGTIVVKEVFDGTDCADYGELGTWAAMRKEAPGFDPEDGDWHWQEVQPDRSVEIDTKASCITCHSRDECAGRDFMCTEE